MGEEQEGWASLPRDILANSVFPRIGSDVVRWLALRGVCKSWRDALRYVDCLAFDANPYNFHICKRHVDMLDGCGCLSDCLALILSRSANGFREMSLREDPEDLRLSRHWGFSRVLEDAYDWENNGGRVKKLSLWVCFPLEAENGESQLLQRISKCHRLGSLELENIDFLMEFNKLRLLDYGISQAHEFGSLKICKLKGLYLGDRHLGELVRLLVTVEYLELKHIRQLIRPRIQSLSLLNFHSDCSVRRIEVEAPKMKICFMGGAKEVIINSDVLEDLTVASGALLQVSGNVQKVWLNGLYWQTDTIKPCLEALSTASHLSELHICPRNSDEDDITDFSGLFAGLKEIKELEMNLNALMWLEYGSVLRPVLLKLETLTINLDTDYVLEIDEIAGLIRPLATSLPHATMRLRGDDMELKQDLKLFLVEDHGMEKLEIEEGCPEEIPSPGNEEATFLESFK